MINNERGVVSILTTSFFSVIVIVITIGTLVVQTKELRQSTDSDQSIRAFYAAQSGMEEALLKLKSDGSFRTDVECQDPDLNLASLDLGGEDSGLELTCVQVTANTVSGSNYLPQDEATQYPLHDQPDIREMTMHWGVTSFDENDSHYTGDPSVLPAMPSADIRSWAIPALMEVTVYSYPESGITPSSIEARTVFLRPSVSGGSTASLNVPDRVQPVRCSGADFTCATVIKDFPSKVNNIDARHVVRFRPRYNETTYAVTFRNGAGDSVSASTGGVKVDVTARAGDVFRRLVAVADGPGEPLKYGLDYAIMAQLDICKDMTVDPASGRLFSTSLIGTGPACHDEEDDDPPDVDGD